MNVRVLTPLGAACCFAIALMVSVSDTGHSKGFGQAATAQSASDYTGFWVNENPRLRFIQFIEITADNPNSLKIHAWLRCFPSPAEGGGLKDCMDWGQDAVSSSSSGEVIWKHDEKNLDSGRERTITFKSILTLEDGNTLRVFTESQGWANYFKRGKKPRQGQL